MKHVTYINAGAGSGKTFNLTKILAERLSDSSLNLQPNQVIMTTFTELAAGEIRERARQKLYSEKFFDKAVKLDSAMIGTVHSVAYTFIKKYWYLLDYGADIQTMSDENQDFYMNQSLASIIDDESIRLFHKHADTFGLKGDNLSKTNHDFWKPLLKCVAEKMDYYNINDTKESIDKSDETIRSIFSAETMPTIIPQLKKYAQNAIDLCEGGKHKNEIDTLKAANDFLSNDNITPEDIKAFNAQLKKAPQKVKNSDWFTDCMDKIESLLVSKDHADSVCEVMKRIFTLAVNWRDDLERFKKENHIISYNDMENIFLQMLTDQKFHDVQDDISQNYRLLMVDEFQDSNPVQIKIFDRISELIGANGGHSIWVGDPKQSIYGFRGSDTELINQLTSKFHFYDDSKMHEEEGENYLGSMRLTESWRSLPKLVNLVNDVFTRSFKDYLDPRLITLKPHYENDPYQTKPLLHWDFKTPSARSITYPDGIAFQIKKLIDEGRKPGDIAVLCRKNKNCEDTAKALISAGIPVSAEIDEIGTQAETMLLVALLKFIQKPSDHHAVADLVQLLTDKSTTDILNDRIGYIADLDKKNKELEEKGEKSLSDEWMNNNPVIQQLSEVRERMTRLSVTDLVNSLVTELNLYNIVSKWGNPTARRNNLSSLCQMAQTYDELCILMQKGASINGFISYLDGASAPKINDNSSNTVKVLTYHRAKGLEWPVVILENLNDDSLKTDEFIKKQFMGVNEIILDSNDDIFNRKYYLQLIPPTTNGNSNIPSHYSNQLKENEVYKSMLQKEKNELKRLLYVGMTRAKEQLITISTNNKPLAWLSNADINSNLSSNDIWGNDQFLPDRIHVDPIDNKSSVKARYQYLSKTYGKASLEPKFISPSTVEHFDCQFKSYEEIGDKADRLEKLDKDMARVGSCIHDIFAVYEPGDDNNRNKALSLISTYRLGDKLTTEVDNILKNISHLYEQLEKLYGPAVSRERETPVQMPLDGQVVHGEIDLIWNYEKDGATHSVLIDYKSFPGRMSEIAEKVQQYIPQLSIYYKALQSANRTIDDTLIYFVVQGQLVKLI